MELATIRPEARGDAPAVFEVNARAFDGEAEARLVEALRKAGRPTISLVGLVTGRIVGHILFSRVEVETNPSQAEVWGLGPMAVLPEIQRRGIGVQMVERGLEDCRVRGVEVVVVLGHAGYYPRFGFLPAAAHGLRFKSERFDPFFMVHELREGALAPLAGMVEYSAEFDDG